MFSATNFHATNRFDVKATKNEFLLEQNLLETLTFIQ